MGHFVQCNCNRTFRASSALWAGDWCGVDTVGWMWNWGTDDDDNANDCGNPRLIEFFPAFLFLPSFPQD